MIEAYQEQLIALEELRGRMPQLRKRERPYYRRPARPARRRAARRRDLHQAPREPRRVPRQTGVPTTSLRGTTLSVRSPLWDVGDVGISRLAKPCGDGWCTRILKASLGRRKSTLCSRFCARSVSTPRGRQERFDRRARFEVASAQRPVERAAFSSSVIVYVTRVRRD
jgi:hypothetical protein